jgi:hypothetical protein
VVTLHSWYFCLAFKKALIIKHVFFLKIQFKLNVSLVVISMSIKTGVCNKCAVSRGGFAHIVHRAVNRRIKDSSCEFLSHAKKRAHMLTAAVSHWRHLSILIRLLWKHTCTNSTLCRLWCSTFGNYYVAFQNYMVRVSNYNNYSDAIWISMSFSECIQMSSSKFWLFWTQHKFCERNYIRGSWRKIKLFC